MNKVVVYGSLLSGFSNHQAYMRTAKLLGECTFRGTMYSLTAFPCVSPHGDTMIHGEMYEVDDETLKALDRLEGHPTFYCREIIETSKGPAWVYLIHREDDEGLELVHDIVRSGSWRDYATRKSDNFAEY